MKDSHEVLSVNYIKGDVWFARCWQQLTPSVCHNVRLVLATIESLECGDSRLWYTHWHYHNNNLHGLPLLLAPLQPPVQCIGRTQCVNTLGVTKYEYSVVIMFFFYVKTSLFDVLNIMFHFKNIINFSDYSPSSHLQIDLKLFPRSTFVFMNTSLVRFVSC